MVINAHGDYNKIRGDGFDIGVEDVLKLKKVKLNSLVLLCCLNGSVSHSTKNIANAFATIIDVPVYASDSLVMDGVFASFRLAEMFKPSLRTQGWLVYQGGNGNYRCLGRRVLKWREI